MSSQSTNDEWCIYDKVKGYEVPKGTSPHDYILLLIYRSLIIQFDNSI